MALAPLGNTDDEEGRNARHLSLVTRETYAVRGRVAHVVDLPDWFIAARDPRGLVGEQITLNGSPVIVWGVETPSVVWTAGDRRFATVALVTESVQR